MGTALYQLIVAYDGSQFKGFQRQLHARTVQGELEIALRDLGWQGRALLSAGRTDSGTHASGQVIAVELNWAHRCEQLREALNHALPVDVAVMQVSVASADFHPRFSATARVYRYQYYWQPVRDPLRERYAWRVWPKPDAKLMADAAGCLIGEWDFSSLGKALKTDGTTIRNVMRIAWQTTGIDNLAFEIEANAFLYHMVRRIAASLLMVGQKRITVKEFVDCFRKKGEYPPGLAPAHGLNLVEVKYGQQSLQEK